MIGFGDRIKESIKKSGLSQKQVAEQAGITTQALTNYVKKDRIPEAIILYKLSKLCSVSMEWLLIGEEHPYESQPQNTTSVLNPSINGMSILPEDLELLAKVRQLLRDNRIRVEGIIDGLIMGQDKKQKSYGLKDGAGREEAAGSKLA